jgi:hypothetical protein
MTPTYPIPSPLVPAPRADHEDHEAVAPLEPEAGEAPWTEAEVGADSWAEDDAEAGAGAEADAVASPWSREEAEDLEAPWFEGGVPDPEAVEDLGDVALAAAPELFGPLEEREGEEEASENEESFIGDLVKKLVRKPTVGFEFDVHFGPVPARDDLNGSVLSTGSKAADGFEVKLDGPRLEVNTRPFETTDAGRQELTTTAARIKAFSAELFTTCRQVGADQAFGHSQLSVPVGKLKTRSRTPNCSVWAAPQATITVRLSKVSRLVDMIRASQGKGAGRALSGGSGFRMGLRSEALYRAQKEVAKARKVAGFSADLEGFLILLASYLWTSELPYRFPAPGAPVDSSVHDYEQFGKAFLPVNVKTPFSQVFRSLLGAADQTAFRSGFADGAARVNLFRLARPAGAQVSDGDRKLLPTGRSLPGDPDVVHAFQRDVFGVVPTWNDLVDHTLDPTHRGWGERLLVTHSTPIDVSKTWPRVLLELRRAGFTTVDQSLWEGFMLRLHALTRDLDR